MSLPPISEEDKPNVERMIKQCVRLRKRQADHNRPVDELSDAIEALHKFGACRL
ncbi:MAG: hypothetical protein HUJ30_02715 [Gammaproteobacteria bacterium]|nr:hypothetical protein [Gammaproteobacteria bacterium]